MLKNCKKSKYFEFCISAEVWRISGIFMPTQSVPRLQFVVRLT